MNGLFEVKKVDVEFYEKNLKSFLPEKFIDIHTHVWLDDFRNSGVDVSIRTAKWPSMVARDNSIEDLMQTYRLMFPDKQVTPMIFAHPENNIDIERSNRYIQQCSNKHGVPSLLLALPEWSSEELKERIISGGFLGTKVYLNYAPSYIPRDEIRIFDFLPHHQLKVLNELGLIVILHIPRDGRLKDPVNLAQMLEIEKRCPNIKLIIAHIGRAYCNEDLGNAFQILSDTENMMFDFSANTNQFVFEQTIRAVGPRRIVFGSDLPILRMRSRRICENGKYINMVPKGLYGDVSCDSHMREVEGKEAEQFTFFMYEEIDAFRKAAESTGLTGKDIEDVFYSNAAKLIESVKGELYE